MMGSSSHWFSDASVSWTGGGGVLVDLLVFSSDGSYSWIRRRDSEEQHMPSSGLKPRIHWCLSAGLRVAKSSMFSCDRFPGSVKKFPPRFTAGSYLAMAAQEVSRREKGGGERGERP